LLVLFAKKEFYKGDIVMKDDAFREIKYKNSSFDIFIVLENKRHFFVSRVSFLIYY